ncbi:MAG: efflux RND transporter periplasmic adaptor subunit [Sphingomonadales bacterium]|nr:efflux RND transporter periplasmic adaptor subunit [Sphingomonadales bacterium]
MHFVTSHLPNTRAALRISALLALALLAACSSGAQTGGAGGPGGRGKGTPEVGFRVMQATSAPVLTELPGRISAFRSAEVRPQISGVIQRRLFTEGSLVHAGQPLYQIDSSLYRASAAQAQANLAAAQASADAAGARAARYKPLAAEQAISQQDYTDAAAAARQARAQVAQTQAALSAARVNLRFATVPAPLTGRIGRSLFTEGALVTGNQSDPLAVISVLDPIFVDIKQSSADMLRLRRQLAGGGAAPMVAEVRLKLDDGSDYGFAGTVEFSEVTVEPASGSVTLRARFPNPQGLLLPGMFARASFAQASQGNVFLVPQAALTRDPKGNAQVYVVGAGNKAEARTVTADRTLGDAWVVSAGLKDGDRVITQGIGKLRPGQPVKPVPESAPQRLRTSPPGGAPAGKAG